MRFEEGIKGDFQTWGLSNQKDGAAIYFLKRVKEKHIREEGAEFGSGHFKLEMPVNTLAEIWNRPKFKRSSPQTHIEAVSMELVFKTLAVGEITKEMNVD